MIPTVNTLTLWRALNPAQQEALGALAIAVELAAQGCTDDEGPPFDLARVRAFEIAADEANCELTDFIVAHCADAYTPAGLVICPDLNALGIRQCIACGCTNGHACSPPCDWSTPTLCTACTTPPEAA